MNQHNANQLHPVCERIDDLSTMKNALTFLGLCMMLLACTNSSMAQTENRGFIVNVGDTMPDFVLNDLRRPHPFQRNPAREDLRVAIHGVMVQRVSRGNAALGN